MGIFSVDLDKINFTDVNFDKDGTGNITHIRISGLWLGVINLNNVKYLKKI